jgi:hypothetical protein
MFLYSPPPNHEITLQLNAKTDVCTYIYKPIVQRRRIKMSLWNWHAARRRRFGGTYSFRLRDASPSAILYDYHNSPKDDSTVLLEWQRSWPLQTGKAVNHAWPARWDNIRSASLKASYTSQQRQRTPLHTNSTPFLLPCSLWLSRS